MSSSCEPGFAEQLLADLPVEDVRRVLMVFSADLPRLVGEIADAAKAGDGEALRKSAHALAGAAGAVGADGLDEACRAAMLDIKANEATLLAHQAVIETQAAIAAAALTRVLNTLDS
jgi:HPt (histidine-containing phosphotransfer) domain-containing protein